MHKSISYSKCLILFKNYQQQTKKNPKQTEKTKQNKMKKPKATQNFILIINSVFIYSKSFKLCQLIRICHYHNRKDHFCQQRPEFVDDNQQNTK